VQIMDAALAEAARRAGDWLACRPGCTQCCHGAFAIGPLDALRLGAGMDALRTQEPALAAEIERRAQAWLDEHGADFPGDRETGLLGDSDADRERFEEFANEAACPALDPATGLCGVYESRPMTCRVFGPPVRMEGGMEGAEGLGHRRRAVQGLDDAAGLRGQKIVGDRHARHASIITARSAGTSGFRAKTNKHTRVCCNVRLSYFVSPKTIHTHP